ncbi:MAG: hypothetical protein HY331_02920 [Chloroflexi bacterium]|nr:hypothetical protein [Chloroflexota bacterium]
MPPRWGQVREFCRKQGYTETHTDHFHYLKVLPDRSTTGTMVSMGADGLEIPSQMWTMIWRRQLRLLSEEEFWRGLRGEPVQYAIPTPPKPAQPLPEYLIRFLRDVLHRTDEEIAATTREQAQRELNAHYSRELRQAEPDEST